jgi:hypothetical protein
MKLFVVNRYMKTILTLFVILWLPTLVVAQKKDSLKQKKDSIALDKTTIYLKQMDSIHLADSMHRIDLLNQIESLKGSATNQEREALLKKLKESEQEDSIKKETQKRQLAKLKASANGFPVAPFGDTLFLIYTRVGSFSAKDRAAAISNKIEKLYDDYEFSPDSLAISISENSTEIFFAISW